MSLMIVATKPVRPELAVDNLRQLLQQGRQRLHSRLRAARRETHTEVATLCRPLLGELVQKLVDLLERVVCARRLVLLGLCDRCRHIGAGWKEAHLGSFPGSPCSADPSARFARYTRYTSLTHGKPL